MEGRNIVENNLYIDAPLLFTVNERCSIWVLPSDSNLSLADLDHLSRTWEPVTVFQQAFSILCPKQPSRLHSEISSVR